MCDDGGRHLQKFYGTIHQVFFIFSAWNQVSNQIYFVVLPSRQPFGTKYLKIHIVIRIGSLNSLSLTGRRWYIAIQIIREGYHIWALPLGTLRICA